MRVWSRLEHANVVPLLGFVNDINGPGLVAPWYSNGDVIKFIKARPHANREIIVRTPFFSVTEYNGRYLVCGCGPRIGISPYTRSTNRAWRHKGGMWVLMHRKFESPY